MITVADVRDLIHTALKNSGSPKISLYSDRRRAIVRLELPDVEVIATTGLIPAGADNFQGVAPQGRRVLTSWLALSNPGHPLETVVTGDQSGRIDTTDGMLMGTPQPITLRPPGEVQIYRDADHILAAGADVRRHISTDDSRPALDSAVVQEVPGEASRLSVFAIDTYRLATEEIPRPDLWPDEVVGLKRDTIGQYLKVRRNDPPEHPWSLNHYTDESGPTLREDFLTAGRYNWILRQYRYRTDPPRWRPLFRAEHGHVVTLDEGQLETMMSALRVFPRNREYEYQVVLRLFDCGGMLMRGILPDGHTPPITVVPAMGSISLESVIFQPEYLRDALCGMKHPVHLGFADSIKPVQIGDLTTRARLVMPGQGSRLR